MGGYLKSKVILDLSNYILACLAAAFQSLFREGKQGLTCHHRQKPVLGKEEPIILVWWRGLSFPAGEGYFFLQALLHPCGKSTANYLSLCETQCSILYIFIWSLSIYWINVSFSSLSVGMLSKHLCSLWSRANNWSWDSDVKLKNLLPACLVCLEISTWNYSFWKTENMYDVKMVPEHVEKCLVVISASFK